MKEYIERAAVEKFIEDGLNNQDKNKAFGHDAIEIMAEIHYMPAADVAPVRHGRWINLSRTSKCSECGFETGKYEPARRFCPMCGCRMIKGDKYDTISNQ